MPTNVSILSPVLMSCNPYEIKLTAQSSTPNVHYSWSNGMTGQSIIVNSGGPYKVTATIGGCSKSAEIYIPKDPTYYSWIFPSGCYDVCKKNLGYLIGPRVPFKYWSWNKNNISSLAETNSIPLPYNISGSGEYTFTYLHTYCELTTEPFTTTEVDCKECSIDDVKVKGIYRNEEEKFCSYDLHLEIDSGSFINAIISSSNNNVTFSPSAFNIETGLHHYVFTVIPTGSFAGGTVEVILQGTDKDGNTCLYTFAIDVPSCFDEKAQSPSSVPSNEIAGNEAVDFKMYPNPATDEVTMSYTGLQSQHEITIFDVMGRLMEKLHTSNAQSSTTINIAKYPSAVYIVVLRKQGHIVSQHKLIKH